MKQKDDKINLVTKDYLKKELKDVKESLRKEIRVSANGLRGEINASADETVRKLEETIIGVKDILMTTMDSFAREIEGNREDRELAAHQTSELKGRVDNHEERLDRLEKPQ